MGSYIELLRLAAVKQRTGHRATASIYGQIREGIFSAPVQIGLRAVGWPSHEVDAIIRARMAGADKEALKALVNKLHQQRQQSAELAA
jgi:prophage regulatory protein